MKGIIIFLLFAFASTGFSQDDELMQDAITRPSMSIRCKELLKERNEKIKIQQRLSALLQRSQSLLNKSPESKETIHARLKANQHKIKNELYLSNLGIQSMEENIVRSGCPGLSL